MQINEARKLIDMWIQDTNLPPLIMVGPAGIGKTQTVFDSCTSAEKHGEIIRVGSLDSPGDMLGLPEIINGITTFTKVEMFERLKQGDVLFLDELNRCKPVLMDSIMQILDQKRLANYDLSHCVILGAMNPDTDDYSVTEMDKAVIDRCLFIKVDNSVEEATSYFERAKMDPRIPELTILAEHNLKVSANYKLPDKEMTLRGLRQLNQILPIVDKSTDNTAMELINACIGPQGVGLWKNKAILKEIPTAKEFLSNPTPWLITEKRTNGKNVQVLDMEPLRKRILLHRINNWVENHKPDDATLFTRLIVKFDKRSMGYIMRNLPHITKRLDKKDGECAQLMNDILSVIN